MNGLLKGSFLQGLFLFSFLHGFCQQDSTRKIADPRLKITPFRTFLMGSNYLHEWMEPLKVPLLDLNDLNITSIKEGGGKETRSLHIEEDNGKKFALRSVEKFPENAI